MTTIRLTQTMIMMIQMMIQMMIFIQMICKNKIK